MSTFRLGPLSQIPVGEGRAFDLGDGRSVAVFHSRTGTVYASQATCPHQGGPLADGILGGSVIMCPLHAWKFDLSSGRPVQGDCGIETYDVEVTPAGQIIVSIESRVEAAA